MAGTFIETARGLIPIEQIGFGDLIWSREEFGNHYAYKPVTATKATDNQQLVEVIVENEQGQQETYLTTTEHPFYVEGIGWLKASLLVLGMKLLDRNGSASLKVVSQNVLDRYATVYNIMVDDHHTYHIGELGVWVHNDKCCEVLDVGSYKDLHSKSKPFDGLQLDHIPSFGALKLAEEAKLGRPLTKSETKSLYEKSTVIAVPDKIHTEGRTYGGKNTLQQRTDDAKDLCGAQCLDLEQHRKNLLKNGYSETEINRAINEVKIKNGERGIK